jgi:hypothetical protein
LRVREFFAPGSVFIDPDQTKSLFQDPVLVLSELESVLIDRERSVELLEQCGGQRLFELADQRGIKGFKRGKTRAQR